MAERWRCSIWRAHTEHWSNSIRPSKPIRRRLALVTIPTFVRRRAETCARGQCEGDLEILDKLSGAVEQTAEYLYQRGATVSALGGNPTEVVALFERAVAADPKHAGALFGLAMENDRHGNDDTAIDLYERSGRARSQAISARC